jgi:hypothetical protein
MKHTIELINTVLTENYFQYNNNYYKCSTGVVMGSPLSRTVTENCLQNYE